VEHAAAGGAEGFEPLAGVRLAMARNMQRAHTEVVPATVHDEADVHDWASPGADVTVRLVQAIVQAAEAEPALNAHYRPGVGRRLHARVDLAVAVDSEEGLFAPVLRDAHALTADAVRDGIEALKAEVTARSLSPEQLRGATLTLSNFGSLAGRQAALVVMPPQVAIVGAGQLRERAVAVDGSPAVRPLLPLSISFDHRVVTGGEATRFLAALIADLERPQTATEPG
jgi:pyruvate dehydrogenase E2 component (dihydrolipoamide acetyltransferase)